MLTGPVIGKSNDAVVVVPVHGATFGAKVRLSVLRVVMICKVCLSRPPEIVKVNLDFHQRHLLFLILQHHTALLKSFSTLSLFCRKIAERTLSCDYFFKAVFLVNVPQAIDNPVTAMLTGPMI
jgi:hypothetical protein